MNNYSDFVMNVTEKKVQKVMTTVNRSIINTAPAKNNTIIFTALNPGTWEGTRIYINFTKFEGGNLNTIKWYLFLRKAGVPDPTTQYTNDGMPFADNNTAIFAAGVEVFKSANYQNPGFINTFSGAVAIDWAIQDGATNTAGGFPLHFIGTTTPPPPAPVDNLGSIGIGPIVYDGAVTATTITQQDIPFTLSTTVQSTIKVLEETKARRRLHTGDQIVFTWGCDDGDASLVCFGEGIITGFFRG